MSCTSPLQGWRAAKLNPSGKRGVVFDIKLALHDMPVTVPCGQCMGCRLERSRQWAVRCMHESSLHDQNCFITLTYNDTYLPKDKSLQLRHQQLLFKRLRKKFGKMRFFACGEYGAKNQRPHYHACIFGFDFPDKVLLKVVHGGFRIYTSRWLEKYWVDEDTGESLGYHSIGAVTFETAAYVARYITKKHLGIHGKIPTSSELLDDEGYWLDQKTKNVYYAQYGYTDENTGEIVGYRRPEYITMSRRPGIANDWIRSYYRDVYAKDSVIISGRRTRPPRYYDSVYENLEPDTFRRIKYARKRRAEQLQIDCTSDRLIIKARLYYLRNQQLKRSLENEI